MKNLTELVRYYVEKHADEITEDLIRLVEIPSLREMPSDNARYGEKIRTALETACDMMKSSGFQAEVEPDGAFAVCDWGEGKSVLGIVPHLDVVPALGEWTGDPFSPICSDGYLIGRGSSDNKGGAVMSIWALRALRACGFCPEGKVRLCFGGNEETGMEDMALLKERYGAPDFSLVPDAFFAVGVGQKGRGVLGIRSRMRLEQIKEFEGGSRTDGTVPEYASCVLPRTAELVKELEALCGSSERLSFTKSVDTVKICAKGCPGHTAMPEESVNAVWILADALSGLNSIWLNDRIIMKELAELSAGYDGGGLGIRISDDLSGPLTAVAIFGEESDGYLHIEFNIRFCIILMGSELGDMVRSHLAQCSVWRYESFDCHESYYFSKDNPEVQILADVYETCMGQPADLYVHPGGTYAKELGNAVIFGNEFRTEIPFPKGRGRAHQADEAVSIADLLEGICLLGEAVQKLDHYLAEKKEETV